MSRLPVSLDQDLNGGIVIFAEDRDAVLNTVMDVAAAVPPVALAAIGNAVREYHESAGQSAAANLDEALTAVPDRIALSLLKLTPEEAVALGVALRQAGLALLGGDAA